MEFTLVSGGPCGDDPSCPAVHRTDRKTAVITGRQLSPKELARLGVGPGENAVEIPIAVYLAGVPGLEEPQ